MVDASMISDSESDNDDRTEKGDKLRKKRSMRRRMSQSSTFSNLTMVSVSSESSVNTTATTTSTENGRQIDGIDNSEKLNRGSLVEFSATEWLKRTSSNSNDKSSNSLGSNNPLFPEPPPPTTQRRMSTTTTSSFAVSASSARRPSFALRQLVGGESDGESQNTDSSRKSPRTNSRRSSLMMNSLSGLRGSLISPTSSITSGSAVSVLTDRDSLTRSDGKICSTDDDDHRSLQPTQTNISDQKESQLTALTASILSSLPPDIIAEMADEDEADAQLKGEEKSSKLRPVQLRRNLSEPMVPFTHLRTRSLLSSGKSEGTCARNEALDELHSNVEDTRAELSRCFDHMGGGAAHDSRRNCSPGRFPFGSAQIQTVAIRKMSNIGRGSSQTFSCNDDETHISDFVVESFRQLVGVLVSLSDALELSTYENTSVANSSGSQGSMTSDSTSSKKKGESALSSKVTNVNASALNGVMTYIPSIDVCFSGIKSVLLSLTQCDEDEVGEKLVVALDRVSTLTVLISEVVEKVNERQEWTADAETVLVTLVALLERECRVVQHSYEDFEGQGVEDTDESIKSGEQSEQELWLENNQRLRRAWEMSGNSESLTQLDRGWESDNSNDSQTETVKPDRRTQKALHESTIAVKVFESAGVWMPSDEQALLFACSLIDPVIDADQEDRNSLSPKPVPKGADSILARIKDSMLPRDREVERIAKKMLPRDPFSLKRSSSSRSLRTSDENPVIIISSNSEHVSTKGDLVHDGMAGTGKSTVAALVVSREDVRRYFRGGIAWLDMGKYPQNAAWIPRSENGEMGYEFYKYCLRSICAELGQECPYFRDLIRMPGEDVPAARRREERLMKLAKQEMIFLMRDWNTLIVLDNVCSPCDVGWFQFHSEATGCDRKEKFQRRRSRGSFSSLSEMVGFKFRSSSLASLGASVDSFSTGLDDSEKKRQSHIIVTTRVRNLNPHIQPIDIDAPTDNEALSLLMMESGQQPNHVMRSSEEALNIVQACGNHPLLIRAVGRWVRLLQKESGFMKSLVDVSESIQKILPKAVTSISVKASSTTQRSRSMDMIRHEKKTTNGPPPVRNVSSRIMFHEILDQSISTTMREDTSNFVKVCLAALISVFYRYNAPHFVVPVSMAKILWEALLPTFQLKFEEKEHKHLLETAHVLAEILSALGIIDMSFEESSDGDVDGMFNIFHEQYEEYGRSLVKKKGWGLGEKSEDEYSRLWNKVFVDSYLDAISEIAWDTSDRDSGIRYALQLLPLHISQADPTRTDMKELLTDDSFIRGRLQLFGIENGTAWHARDCLIFFDTAQEAALEGSGDEFYANDTLVLAFESLSKHIFSEIRNDNNDQDHKLSGEAGRAFQEMGFSLCMVQDQNDAIARYETSIDFFRTMKEFGSVSMLMLIIGIIHKDCSNYSKSKEALIKAQQIRKKHFNKNGMFESEVHRAIGDLQLAQDKYEEAAQSYQSALSALKLSINDNRIYVSDVLQSQGSAHQYDGELDKAIEVFEESMKYRSMENGSDDPDLSHALYSIGTIYIDQGKRLNAIPCFEESLRLRQLIESTNDLSEADVLSAEGMLCVAKEEQDRALECLKSVVTSCERVGLDKDLRVAGITNEIAKILSSKGEFAEASTYLISGLQTMKEKMGFNLAVAKRLYNLGSTLARAGEYDASLHYLIESLEMKKGLLGEENERVAAVFHEIGTVYEKMGEFVEAASWINKEVSLLGKIHGKDNEVLVPVALTLGNIQRELAHYSRALSCFREAYRIREETCNDEFKNVGILYEIATMQEKLCNYDEAMRTMEEVLRIRVANLGYNSHLVVQAVGDIGDLHLLKGNYSAAMQSFNEMLGLELSSEESDRNLVVGAIYGKGCVQLYEGNLEESKKSFEECLHWKKSGSDTSLAPIHKMLGKVLYEKGDIAAAKRCFEEAIRLKRLKKYRNEEDNAELLYLKGTVLDLKGEEMKSFSCHWKALLALKELFGKDHEKVAESQHQIALLCVARNEFKKARKMFEESLRVRRKVFGNDHLLVADSLFNIAFVYISQDIECKKSLDCLEECLRIRRTKLGDSIKIALTLEKIGNVHKAMGQYDEAKASYEEALEIERRIHKGDEDENIARLIYEMGDLMDEIQEYDQAMDLFDSALGMQKHTLGHDHPDVASTLYRMGFVVYTHFDFDSAIDYFEASLDIRKRCLGTEHSSVGDTLNALGCLYSKKREDDAALRCLCDAYAIRKQADDYTKAASTLMNIGYVHKGRKRYEEAIDSYDECLRLRKLHLDPDYETVADTWTCLGNVHVEFGESPDVAMKCYEEAIRIKTLKHGCNSVVVADMFHKMGILSLKAGNDEKGKHYLEEYMRVKRLNNEDNDEAFATAITVVGNTCAQEGDMSKAYKCWTTALKIYKSLGLDKSNPNVVFVKNNMEQSWRYREESTWFDRIKNSLTGEKVP